MTIVDSGDTKKHAFPYPYGFLGDCPTNAKVMFWTPIYCGMRL